MAYVNNDGGIENEYQHATTNKEGFQAAKAIQFKKELSLRHLKESAAIGSLNAPRGAEL